MKKKPAIQTATIIPPSHEDISQRARELWEGYDRPQGRDEAIWLEAERQLLGIDPNVESKDNIAVSARDFGQSAAQGKTRARPDKNPAARAA